MPPAPSFSMTLYLVRASSKFLNPLRRMGSVVRLVAPLLYILRRRNTEKLGMKSCLGKARGVGTITGMNRKSLFALSFLTLLFVSSVEANAASQTMRVDYYHTGNQAQEMFSLDRVVIEPGGWPGNPPKNIDDTNLGKYFFEVRDRNTKRVLYSRGFASIYS